MNLDEIFEEAEFKKFEDEWRVKHKLALGFNWGYGNWKRFVSQFLKRRHYSEDQWIFDYKCYVDGLKPNTPYSHPVHWAEDHYGKDWDRDKVRQSLKNLLKK